MAGTINLTVANGQLSIITPTTLNGDAGVTTIDAGGSSCVLSTAGSSVTLNDLRLQNGAVLDSEGAGIRSSATLLTLNRVTVTGNTLDSASGGFAGAGIQTSGTAQALVLNDSTVSGNTIIGIGGMGGGIRAGGPLTLNRSTVSGNSTTLDVGGRGGGIDASAGSAFALTISNSTISGNHSGGNFGNGGGGGVFATPLVNTSIVGSTIAGNTTLGFGGGVFLQGGDRASENTIYAGNTDTQGGPNCAGGFGTADNNIDTGTSCGFGTTNGNQENVGAGQLGLGALASNGGPTQTRAIAPASVALNAASGGCGGLGVDQRGVTRPFGATCDIGAFELEYRTLTVSTAGTGTGTVAGTGIGCPGDCSEVLAQGTQVTLTPTQAAGSTFSGWSGACSGSGACVVTLDADKAITATFTANPPTPPGTTTPAKKCKKGQKLKKGKCVKKKRKKK